MPPVSDESQRKNQLASDWMHQGMALAQEGSLAGLDQAIRCFDEAIALRRTLPLNDHPFFRYGLSAGWINRGDALARREGEHFLAEALKSYDEALTLLGTLSLEENVLYPRRLAITWINRGIALQKRETFPARGEAAECFRQAIQVLGQPSAAALSSLLAGAWINLAGVLMDSGDEAAEEIRAAARQALAGVENSGHAPFVSIEIGLKARHILCRLAVKEILNQKPLSKTTLAEATDAVDEAMALARNGKLPGRDDLVQLAREIFRFGCRIYASRQPHFLAEFLMECLSPETGGEQIFADQETFDAALAAVWGVFDQLQLDGFRFVSTPCFEPFLSDIQELKKVEERLKQWRCG